MAQLIPPRLSGTTGLATIVAVCRSAAPRLPHAASRIRSQTLLALRGASRQRGVKG